MMIRQDPESYLYDKPCCYVAVACALGEQPTNINDFFQQIRDDGYATLQKANRFIRDNLNIKGTVTYKKGEIPLLKDLKLDRRAIVLVIGHFVYVDGDKYWSYFQNDFDEVVQIWFIKD